MPAVVRVKSTNTQLWCGFGLVREKETLKLTLLPSELTQRELSKFNFKKLNELHPLKTLLKKTSTLESRFLLLVSCLFSTRRKTLLKKQVL